LPVRLRLMLPHSMRWPLDKYPETNLPMAL
jgi:hypothetical protein